MEKLNLLQSSLIAASYQALLKDKEFFFQVVDLFPIPIKVFTPDGIVVFANQAVLEMWNISEPSQIVGKYNLKTDPVVNEQLGLKEYVDRALQGEVVLVPEVKVPLEDFSVWYKARSDSYDIESIYTDILNFPIYDKDRKIIYIVSVFLTTRIYRGKSDIARAKEYIENHWLEEFDIDKTAQAVHLSRYHFSRLFKKYSGMTPYSYYQTFKIKKLKEALCDKQLSISQAFSSCGLEYHGSFVRIFKEKVGMSPSQYRKTVIY